MSTQFATDARVGAEGLGVLSEQDFLDLGREVAREGLRTYFRSLTLAWTTVAQASAYVDGLEAYGAMSPVELSRSGEEKRQVLSQHLRSGRSRSREVSQ